MTLAEIEKDIADGKSKRIYYSPGTVWWTHLEEDVKESTDTGRIKMKQNSDNLMKNPKVPAPEKQRLKALYEATMNMKTFPPLDPSGCPLMYMDDPAKFIQNYKAKPLHCGRYGLQAFVKAHHRNSTGKTFKNWDDVNRQLDLN